MERVTILCSDPGHPINPVLEAWAGTVAGRAEVRLVRDVAEVGDGDFLFLIACQQIVAKPVRDRFDFVLVVHASDLPKGRGWSPLVWQLLEGENDIPVTLLNAEDGVDSGAVWITERVHFEGIEVHQEIHDRVSRATVALMSWALDNCRSAQPREQSGEPTYYRKRTPADSELKPDMTIGEAFDLLRVCDPVRYPAFFDHRGQRYTLKLERIGPSTAAAEEE